VAGGGFCFDRGFDSKAWEVVVIIFPFAPPSTHQRHLADLPPPSLRRTQSLGPNQQHHV